MLLSVVINTKNMASTLEKTLKSVEGLANEVVVVDMLSTDHTVELAKKHGARVYSYEKDLGFADPARNFALSKAKGEWVLVLDADEELSEGLKDHIHKILTGDVSGDEEADAYFLARQNIIFDKSLEKTGWWPDYQLRLFKKGMVSWTDKVHTAPVASGKTLFLPPKPELSIIHHNYQTVSQFLHRLDRYTSVEVSDQGRQGRDKSAKEQTPAELIQAFSGEFFRRLFLQEGIDEGMHGVSLSFLQGVYEAVVILKLWEKNKFPETKKDQATTLQALNVFQKELGYWIADYQVQHTSGLSQLWWKLKRKLKI